MEILELFSHEMLKRGHNKDTHKKIHFDLAQGLSGFEDKLSTLSVEEPNVARLVV